MKDEVKIVFIGDEGVGKSSFISTYISKHFSQKVPHVMTDAIIPSEITSDDVLLTIMDSSSRLIDREVLKSKIISSDAVIILYDITRPETLENISHIWLPLVTSLTTINSNTNNNNDNKNNNNIDDNNNNNNNDSNDNINFKPVIIVGTKTDLLDEEPDLTQMNSLILDFPCIMNNTTCSSFNMQNLDHIIFLSLSLINYPLYTIFNIIEEEFTPVARYAFQRIFRIYDINNDNLLSDDEIFNLQLNCFQNHMNNQELTQLKFKISSIVNHGIIKNQISFDGFLGLLKMNIYAYEYQVPWIILRKCGYNDDLTLEVGEN
jgi:Ras family protein T1